MSNDGRSKDQITNYENNKTNLLAVLDQLNEILSKNNIVGISPQKSSTEGSNQKQTSKIELIDYSIEDVLNSWKDAKRLSDDSAKVVERQIRDRASNIKSTFTTYSRGFDNLLRQLRKRHTQQDSIDRQEALIKRQQQ